MAELFVEAQAHQEGRRLALPGVEASPAGPPHPYPTHLMAWNRVTHEPQLGVAVVPAPAGPLC